MTMLCAILLAAFTEFSSRIYSPHLGDFYELGEWVPNSVEVGTTNTAGSSEAYVEIETNVVETTKWKCFFREDVMYGKVDFPDGTSLPAETVIGEWHESSEMPEPQWISEDDWGWWEAEKPFWLVGIGYFDTDPPDSEFKKYLPADVRTNAWRNAQWGTPINCLQKKPHDADELGTKDAGNDWENAISYNCGFDYDVWWKFEDYPAIPFQRYATVIFYMYYEADEQEIEKVPTGKFTPNIHRLTPDVMAGINSTFEGFFERMYYASQGQSNAWDEAVWGDRLDKWTFDFTKFGKGPIWDWNDTELEWPWATNRVFKTRRLVHYDWLRDLSEWFVGALGHTADDFWSGSRTFMSRPSWIVGDDFVGKYRGLFDGYELGVTGEPWGYSLAWGTTQRIPSLGIDRKANPHLGPKPWTQCRIKDLYSTNEIVRAWPTFRYLRNPRDNGPFSLEFLYRLSLEHDMDEKPYFNIDPPPTPDEDPYYHIKTVVTNDHSFPKLDIGTVITNWPPTRRILFDHFASANAMMSLMDRTYALPLVVYPDHVSKERHVEEFREHAKYFVDLEFRGLDYASTIGLAPKCVSSPEGSEGGVEFCEHSYTNYTEQAETNLSESIMTRDVLRVTMPSADFNGIARRKNGVPHGVDSYSDDVRGGLSVSNSVGLIYLTEREIANACSDEDGNVYMEGYAMPTYPGFYFTPRIHYSQIYESIYYPLHVGDGEYKGVHLSIFNDRLPGVIRFYFDDTLLARKEHIVSWSHPLNINTNVDTNLRIGPIQPGASAGNRACKDDNLMSAGFGIASEILFQGVGSRPSPRKTTEFVPFNRDDDDPNVMYEVKKEEGYEYAQEARSKILSWREELRDKMIDLALAEAPDESDFNCPEGWGHIPEDIYSALEHYYIYPKVGDIVSETAIEDYVFSQNDVFLCLKLFNQGVKIKGECRIDEHGQLVLTDTTKVYPNGIDEPSTGDPIVFNWSDYATTLPNGERGIPVGELKLSVENFGYGTGTRDWGKLFDVPAFTNWPACSLDGKVVPVTSVDWKWHTLKREDLEERNN